jgi:hypothetical protein
MGRKGNEEASEDDIFFQERLLKDADSFCKTVACLCAHLRRCFRSTKSHAEILKVWMSVQFLPHFISALRITCPIEVFPSMDESPAMASRASVSDSEPDAEDSDADE